MAKNQIPLGRPRRVRIRLVCHTGIRPFRKFLDVFDGLRLSNRQEYLRRCLVTGLRLGRSLGSVWSEDEAGGSLRKLQIDVSDGDPDLTTFLQEYDSRAAWPGRNLWILETILSGYEILSGSLEEKKSLGGQGEGSGRKGDRSPAGANDFLGGLFS